MLLTNIIWKRQKATAQKRLYHWHFWHPASAHLKRLSVFLLFCWCCSVNGELFWGKDNVSMTEIPLTGKWCLQIYLPSPSLPFLTRQSLHQPAKVDCQAIKAIFVFQLHHTSFLPFYFLPSHLLVSSHYMFSLQACVCACLCVIACVNEREGDLCYIAELTW